MSAPALTDDALWKHLRNGDELAFSALFERYYGSLVSYGRSLMAAQECVPDCVQDVFIDVWRYRQSLNEVSSVKAYLLSSVRKRIARLHERDHIFRPGRRSGRSAGAAPVGQTASLDTIDFLLDFSIEEQLIADETTAAQVRQLNHLINALPPRQKEALFLRYHHGLSVEQIAETMHINYQSAVNTLHRAIQQLRQAWKGELTLLLYFLAGILPY